MIPKPGQAVRLPLDFGQREDCRRRRGVCSGNHDRRELRREAVELQHAGGLEQNGALDGVLELAHVAGPVVPQQQESVAFRDTSRTLRQKRERQAG